MVQPRSRHDQRADAAANRLSKGCTVTHVVVREGPGGEEAPHRVPFEAWCERAAITVWCDASAGQQKVNKRWQRCAITRTARSAKGCSSFRVCACLRTRHACMRRRPKCHQKALCWAQQYACDCCLFSSEHFCKLGLTCGRATRGHAVDHRLAKCRLQRSVGLQGVGAAREDVHRRALGPPQGASVAINNLVRQREKSKAPSKPVHLGKRKDHAAQARDHEF